MNASNYQRSCARLKPPATAEPAPPKLTAVTSVASRSGIALESVPSKMGEAELIQNLKRHDF
jgi:hypothetical protein